MSEHLPTGPSPPLYTLSFSPQDWAEIQALGSVGFEPKPAVPLSRAQWLAIAQAAADKAECLRQGSYTGDRSGTNAVDDYGWAWQLTEISNVILKEFQPGDGKL